MNNIEVNKRRRSTLSPVMANKQDFSQLLKKFGAYVSLRLSNLFPFSLLNLDSRSVGAVAGLAIAILFTYKLLKSPAGSQRRQPKRQAPGTSASVVNNHSSINLASSEDMKTHNAKDELLQNFTPTLGQVVRQKLNDGRKVTCSLLGVILEETNPEELQKQATVKSSVLEVVLEITKHTDLYFMERVLDDESEKRVLQALEDAGLFSSSSIVKDKKCNCRYSFVARKMEGLLSLDNWSQIGILIRALILSFSLRDLLDKSFIFRLPSQKKLPLMFPAPHLWNGFSDAFEAKTRC